MKRRITCALLASAALTAPGAASAQAQEEAPPLTVGVESFHVPATIDKLVNRGVRVTAFCNVDCVLVVKVRLPAGVAAKLGLNKPVIGVGVGRCGRRGAEGGLRQGEGGGGAPARQLHRLEAPQDRRPGPSLVSSAAVPGTSPAMATATASTNSAGILSENATDKREEIIGLLQKAYWMEIETVMSYIANSVNPDGIRAQEIKESLEEDIQEELGHAKLFAERIKELYGVVPGSEEFSAEQSFLQPPESQTDIVHVVKGVIEAETGAIEHYTKIVEVTDQVDPVTQDMVIDILHDEQGHKRLFEGFLRELEADGLA